MLPEMMYDEDRKIVDGLLVALVAEATVPVPKKPLEADLIPELYAVPEGSLVLFP